MSELEKKAKELCQKFLEQEIGNRLSEFAMIGFYHMLTQAIRSEEESGKGTKDPSGVQGELRKHPEEPGQSPEAS